MYEHLCGCHTRERLNVNPQQRPSNALIGYVPAGGCDDTMLGNPNKAPCLELSDRSFIIFYLGCCWGVTLLLFFRLVCNCDTKIPV